MRRRSSAISWMARRVLAFIRCHARTPSREKLPQTPGLPAVVADDDPLEAEGREAAKLSARGVELPAECGLRARLDRDRAARGCRGRADGGLGPRFGTKPAQGAGGG